MKANWSRCLRNDRGCAHPRSPPHKILKERSLIAQRTRDALKASKARGVVLGNPNLADVRNRAVASTKAEADRFAKNVAPIIREIQSSGVASLRGIARSLVARGIATARGGEWTAVQVGSILQRVQR